MARIAKPLTATQVRNAKPKDKPYKIFDGGGLCLQASPSGGMAGTGKKQGVAKDHARLAIL